MIRHFTRAMIAAAFVLPSAAENAPDAAAADQADPASAVDPAVMRHDSSYALGYRTGAGFTQQFGRFGVTVDDLETDAFLQGFVAAVKGMDPELGEDALQQAMESLGNQLQEREQKIATDNLAKGGAFLEENAQRDGVVTTESGLQYEIMEPGGEATYQAPAEGEAEKQFMVNYRGTLIDGTEFDASPEGQPVPMTMQVIDGFREALTSMPVGAKWRLFIPSELAYGDERRSAQIAPNSVLIFELELVSIEDAPAQQGFPFPMPGN